MASRNNPYQRDPNLAKAFDNIASLFAPPGGTDAAGYAAAGLNNAKRQQLEWLFQNSGDPTAAARSALTGVQTYGNTPEGFMKSDATTRRQQDLTAATTRENNIRDNARAMATTRYGAIGEGQILPELPQSVAGMYGLPAAPAQTGVVKLGQNQTATLPDGTTMTGINRPQTMDEWQAQNAERMRQSGALPDTSITDLIMGKQTPAFTLGPDGKTPVYANMGEAIRKQLPAAAAPSSTPVKRDTGTAFMPDGRQVPVTRSPDGMQWVDQSGAPVPPEAKVTNMATPQGSLDQVGATTANNSEANKRGAEVTRTLNLLDSYEKLITENPGVNGIVGLVRGTAQNAAQTVNDLTQAFGKDQQGVQEFASELRGGLQKVAPGLFDPKIPEADFYKGALAYALARTENPSGEVSRQAYERAYERIQGGGLLANQQSALAQIGAFRNVLKQELSGIGALRNPGTARTDTTNQTPAGPVERWERGSDGQLRKVQ